MSRDQRYLDWERSLYETLVNELGPPAPPCAIRALGPSTSVRTCSGDACSLCGRCSVHCACRHYERKRHAREP